jgi:hypothetical protein
VPDMGTGRCLEPEGKKKMGSACGKGVREGPAPQEVKEKSSQCSARAGITWTRTRKSGQVGHDEEGSAQTE